MSAENDDNAVESLLRGMPLRSPSSRLDPRVDAVFEAHRQAPGSSEYLRDRRLSPIRAIFMRPAIHRMAIAAGILIAVGIGVRLSLPRHQPSVAVAPPVKTLSSQPIRFEQETSTDYDDGIVAGTDQTAYQQYRRRTVREIYYEDPKTHAKLQVTIPTEQIVIQKVEAY